MLNEKGEKIDIVAILQEQMREYMDELQLLTYAEVAQILRVKRCTIRSWASRGIIRKSVRLGRASCITLAEVKRFIRERLKSNVEREQEKEIKRREKAEKKRLEGGVDVQAETQTPVPESVPEPIPENKIEPQNQMPTI